MIYAPPDVVSQLATSVTPGDAFEVVGLPVDAVPAYNRKAERRNFHPKGNGWVGYVIAIEGVRYYHAGDTDLIPEMERIDCDVAFLPIGGTYTMDAAEAAEAARVIGPRTVVPMHYGFVVGSSGDAKVMADLAAPLPVQALEPEVPFER